MPFKETKKVEFNVNQVIEALEKYSGLKIYIEGVYVADLTHQWDPVFKEIGMGGVMTVVCEVE